MKRKTAYIAAPRTIEFVEEEIPRLGAHDVLLKTVSVGVCHSDLPRYQGAIGSELSSKGFQRFHNTPGYPSATGHEPVCVVSETGRAVTRFRVGDYVSGYYSGAYSTHLTVPDSIHTLFKLPSYDGDIRRFCLEPVGAVVNIVRNAGCRLGEYAAVVGCGFMGLMTIAGLRGCGAKEIVAIDLLDEKLDWAKKYGATKTINASCHENIDEIAFDMTDGHFFDVVVEITGSLRGLDTAAKIIQYTHDPSRGSAESFRGAFLGNGRILIPSVYGAQETFPVSLAFNLMMRTPTLLATHPNFGYSPYRDMETAIEAFISRKIPVDEVITHEIPFADLGKAFEMSERPPAGYIKGLVTFE